jgi:hypothetical protein
MRIVALLGLACLLVGCAPDEPAKQAEEIGSIAAEGALLAHDAAEGSSTKIFVREHAEALDRRLGKTRSVVDDRRLASLAASVSDELVRLAEEPGDERRTRSVEQSLERRAKEAAELAE